jgi:hypothetical protein
VFALILSIDESIQKLKTEILSQDWSLSLRKIEPLAAAFTCLKNRFSTRKNLLAILTMADSVLQFARKREASLPPEFIDFLKETMAHIVTIYEDNKFDPDKEAEIFKRVYAKFSRLREKVQAEHGSPGKARKSSPADQEEMKKARLPLPAPVRETTKRTVPLPLVPPSPTTKTTAASTAAQPLSGTLVRTIILGETCLGIPEEDIALVRQIDPKKRARCIENNQVPLKELATLFRSLSGEIKGSLAGLQDGRLKKLVLPLMVPRGMDLATVPDQEASSLLVLSRGQWHGAVICRQPGQKPAPLLGFTGGQNGDIAGRCRMENNRELLLLDTEQMLKREGFFSLPG